MGVDAANVSWLTLVTSSAVVSALVNVGWNAWVKYLDRKREDAKDAKMIGHIYLDIALQLEGFAKRCDARLYDIDRGLSECAVKHDETYLQELKPFVFSFDPEPNWSELPIRFVAKMKVLPDQYASTREWIGEQWEYWANLDDVYRLEEQSVSYYGLKACEIAAEIRHEIDAGLADGEALVERFRAEIEQRREAFRGHRNEITLIPELEAVFSLEVSTLREVA